METNFKFFALVVLFGFFALQSCHPEPLEQPQMEVQANDNGTTSNTNTEDQNSGNGGPN